MLNRSARAERIINAHVGAINSARWSPDGTGLLTAGEDGIIKVWSKLGMLRSTIIQNETPIRVACWSANSMKIAYCTGSFIAIKPLAANSKLIKVRQTIQQVFVWFTNFQFISFFSGVLMMAVSYVLVGQRRCWLLVVMIADIKFGIARDRSFLQVSLRSTA